MIHDVQSVSYQSRYISVTFSDTDFALLARALGGQGYHVEKPSEIGPIMKEALQKQGPVVISVAIDNTEIPPMKPRMLALRRSLGLPGPMESFSWNAIKALWRMIKER
jgi:thiamine pyrophosphate-dependent acetolactate synthase large subunit-like protein